MALSFTGLNFPGTHSHPLAQPPRPVGHRRHFAGLNGMVENWVGNTGRPIQYELVVHSASFRAAKDVVALLAEWDNAVGAHGTLTETGNITRSFSHVTFDGCTQLTPILRDVAKTLQSEAETYWCRVLLDFYQLFTGDDK